MAKKALVIGAGFGGLASALVLATRGYKVTVVEASHQTGGKAGMATVDNVSFDTGPSLLTLPEVLEQLFALGGVNLRDHMSLRKLSPAFRYHYPDGTLLDVHHDLDATLTSVRETLGGNAARELADFLDYAARIWKASAPHFVFGNAPSVRAMMGRDFMALIRLPAIDAMSTMYNAICERVKSPHLRTLLARYATYNGSDVRQCPATLNCISHVELTLGGYGVRGGMHSIATALTELCIHHGVSFELGVPVARVETHRKAVVGVQTRDGRSISTDLVVSNAEAQHLFQDLLPRKSWWKRTEPDLSMSAYNVVYKASRQTEQQRVAHEVLFPNDYMDEFAAIFDRGTAPLEPTLYVCDQSVAHAIDGWKDATPLFVMINSATTQGQGGSEDRWAEMKIQMTERLTRAGLVLAGDPIVWERTPTDLAGQYPRTYGSIYGASSNTIWSAFRRPANRVRGVKGLYLATGSAHPGGGVPLCLLSGIAAARAIISDHKGNDNSLRVGAI